MAHESLVEYIEAFEQRGREPAYVQRRGYRTIRCSYQEIANNARRFARELESRHIGPGDLVLIWGENCAEWVVAFWGCVLRGAVSVPMDRISAPEFALRVCQQLKAKLVVASREQSQHIPDVNNISFDELLPRISVHSNLPYRAHKPRRADTVEIVFTSGTTAEPKGTVISHGNILANLEPIESEIRKYLRYEHLVHPLRFLNLLPLSHVFGQSLGIFIPQLLGATVIFQETLSPAEIIRTIKRERVSVLVAVPRILRSLKEKIERDYQSEDKLEAFRQQLERSQSEHFLMRWLSFRKIHSQLGWKFWACISGGAALDADTEEFWRRLGFVVIQGYGLTETTSMISVNHPFKVGKGSIGQVLPGREVKLDQSGEILVRGENIASAYWQNKEMKSLTGDEGWFRTGDLGELDEHGNLYFKGRSKSVIVTSEGINVHPQDLETALRRQPEVTDCVVIGLPNNGNAEPYAVLILSPGADPEKVIQRANDSLAEFQHIRRFLVWPERDFPRTSTGKPRIKLIEQTVLNNAQATGQGTSPSGSLAELIVRITGRAQPGLSRNAELDADLNLSSLDRVELLCAIEDRYQVDLDESTFSEVKTISDLETLLHQPAAVHDDQVFPRWPQRWPVTWVRFLAYYLLVWPATMLLGAPKIVGRENLEGVHGPVLVICNHVTYLDGALVLAALPVRLRHRLAVAMEGDRLRIMRNPPASFNFIWRWANKIGYVLLIAVFNVFPLPQRTGVRRSFMYAGECADRGYNVLVFPEGRRTPDGNLQPFRSGIGMLAKSLNLPVVPMRIKGLWELKQAGKNVAAPGDVSVVIARPTNFEKAATQDEITEELQGVMESL